MPRRELNIANAAERMATDFAVGVIDFAASLVEEFSCVPSVASEQRSSGRHLSHLGKFNTCQWHSACTKFGHSDSLITLSHWRSPITTPLFHTRTRAEYRLSLHSAMGGHIVYSHHCPSSKTLGKPTDKQMSDRCQTNNLAHKGLSAYFCSRFGNL